MSGHSAHTVGVIGTGVLLKQRYDEYLLMAGARALCTWMWLASVCIFWSNVSLVMFIYSFGDGMLLFWACSALCVRVGMMQVM